MCLDWNLLDAAERQNMSPLHEINQATRSSDQDIASLLELIHLVAGWCTAISDAGAEH